MAQQNNTQTQQQYQEYQELLIRLPIYDDSIWVPLQKKNFKEAMDRFYGILGYYTSKTAPQIFWRSIIEGKPDVRGDVSYSEWIEEVVPPLAIIILNIADEKLLEKIYRSLSPGMLAYFNSLVASEIPGISDEEKTDFLKKEKPWLYTYFTGSPLNVLNGGLFLKKTDATPTSSLENVAQRIVLLPPGLKNVLFSPETARTIVSICEKNGLNAQETTEISYYTGAVLLGLADPDEFSESIEKACNFSSEKAFGITEEIKEEVINTYSDEITSLKEESESIIKEKEIPVPIRAVEEQGGAQPVKITKVKFPKLDEEKKETADLGAPLILHKEQDVALGEKKGAVSPFAKGSVFSFGFFKPRGERKAPEPSGPVSVKIESSEKAPEKTLPPAPPVTIPVQKSPAPSRKAGVFEQIKSELGVKSLELPVKDLSPAPLKIPETEKTKEAPPAAPAYAGRAGNQASEAKEVKTVHYSQFKTELSNELGVKSNEPEDKQPDPHVEGNTVFFK